MTGSLKVKVWRGKEQGSFASYDVPRRESQTVLDVVTYIQRHLDNTLSYRFSCRVSKVAGDGELEIAPLSNLPVIKDLATDMREFFDKWARAKGQFKGTRTRHDEFAKVDPASKERLAANAGIECIGCGVCYASCDVVTWRPAFLGPAALNRAWTLANDVRDDQQAERLRAVAGDAGCHACHTQGSCTQRCPKQIAPTAGISGLKVLTARAAMRGKL
jgi:fumarate reductase iron-sulfur subunit